MTELPPKSPALRRAILESEYDTRQLAELDRIEREREAAEPELLQRGELERFLDLYWTSNRWIGFARIHHLLTDEQYWQRLRGVWQEVEVPGTDLEWWREMFTAERPGRETMMEDAEHATLAALPEQVEIYRGVGHPRYARGLSWTLARDEAVRFAGRAVEAGRAALVGEIAEPAVVIATVARADVIGLFDRDGGEREVVALPENVTIKALSRLRALG